MAIIGHQQDDNSLPSRQIMGENKTALCFVRCVQKITALGAIVLPLILFITAIQSIVFNVYQIRSYQRGNHRKITTITIPSTSSIIEGVNPRNNINSNIIIINSNITSYDSSITTTSVKNSNKSHDNSRTSLLGCADIAGLEIVRVLGEGMQKTAFEVKLPSGEHAVAKRCNSYKCYTGKLIAEEAEIFRGLHKQYGDEGALRFFGECYAPFDKLPSKKASRSMTIKKRAPDFSVGHTSVIELGKPLLQSWNIPLDDSCFKGYFTPRDIEDLTNIARRYANYSDSPIMLAPLGKRLLNKNITKGTLTDNIHPQQYIVRTGGGGTSSPSSSRGEGTIHHTDLDMTYLCMNHYKEHICQVDRILEVNCKVISELTGIPLLDCSFPVPTIIDTSDTTTETSKTSPVVSVDASSYSDRINATHAIEECVRRWKQDNP
jgi:hypothetical protein